MLALLNQILTIVKQLLTGQAGAAVQEAATQAKLVERTGVTKERISRELERMAFVDARRLFKWTTEGVSIVPSDELSDDDAAAVVEVSQTVTLDGGTIRVKVADKKGALMDLAKLHGYIIERKDLRVIRAVTDLTDDELAAIAAGAERDKAMGETRH